MSGLNSFKAVIIGVSAGGLSVLSHLLGALPGQYPLPIAIVQHRMNEPGNTLESILQEKTKLTVKQADEKEPLRAGHVYIGPPGYHLLIEQDGTFSLSSDQRVNFSIPSIDVLFESAADVYRHSLIAILMTGANADGAAGLLKIKKSGGVTIAQDPAEAEYPVMPQSAINMGAAAHTLKLNEICDFLIKISRS